MSIYDAFYCRECGKPRPTHSPKCTLANAARQTTTGPSNIMIWRGVTRHDLPVDRLLDAVKEQGLTSVVILGWKDGEPYFASSMADGGDVMWLMRNCEKKLLEVEL